MSLSVEDRNKLSALKKDLPQKFKLQITDELREHLKSISQNPAILCVAKLFVVKIVAFIQFYLLANRT